MQTISTKLDKNTANKFLEICNNEGKCQSEFLRDMIEQIIETNDIDEENTRESPKPTIEDMPRTTGKLIGIVPEPTIEFIPELTNIRIE
jgi:hypothetical protein